MEKSKILTADTVTRGGSTPPLGASKKEGGNKMPHHKITSKSDIFKVMGMPYEGGAIFQILETGEMMDLHNIIYHYDAQTKPWSRREITIQYAEGPGC